LEEFEEKEGFRRSEDKNQTTNRIGDITYPIGILTPMLSILFGSELREKILLYLEECGEAYSSELAKNFDASLFAVQSQFKRLEDAGILVSRTVGKTRMFSINPRYFLRNELISLLKKNLEALPEKEIAEFYRPRRRTRRSGKPV
jgi:DNA-binding transcriptional ArsR family regulator